jgi:hypothetical protein
MNNIFKTNTRFAALAEDIPVFREKNDRKDKPKQIQSNMENRTDNGNSFKSVNSFKNQGYSNFQGSGYQRLKERYDAEDKAKKEFDKQEQERRIEQSLQIENFPELVQPKSNIVINVEQNYIEKLKKFDTIQDENANIDPDLRNLKPGWIILKKDALTNKTIVKGKTDIIQNQPITEQQIVSNVFHALNEQHERRTQEYIELNGYDIWERLFKSPNWREWEAEYEYEYEDDNDTSDDDEDDHNYEYDEYDDYDVNYTQ